MLQYGKALGCNGLLEYPSNVSPLAVWPVSESLVEAVP